MKSADPRPTLRSQALPPGLIRRLHSVHLVHFALVNAGAGRFIRRMRKFIRADRLHSPSSSRVHSICARTPAASHYEESPQ